MRLIIPLLLAVFFSGCLCCGGGDGEGFSLDSILGGLKETTTTTMMTTTTTTPPTTTLPATTTTQKPTTTTVPTTSTTTTTLSKVKCYTSKDCGESYAKYYCYPNEGIGANIYKQTYIPSCKNAGTEQSYCVFITTGGHTQWGQPLPPEESCGAKKCVKTSDLAAECQ